MITLGEIKINSILKKLSVLMVMFVFLGLFGVEVSAKETNQTTQIEIKDGKAILSEEDYYKLLDRIEKLEELKESDVNKNLFNYYEKSKADRETSISEMFDGVTFVVTIAGVIVAIAGVLMLFNFANGTLASMKAKKTNKKAEEKLLLLDKTEKRLDFYIKRASAQTARDLDSSIQIYNEIIDDMEKSETEDEYIFYDLGNAYLSKFKLELEITENYENDVEIEIKNLEKIYIRRLTAQHYENLLTNAIEKFKKFLEKNSEKTISTIANLRIAECSIYIGDYAYAFKILNNIDYNEIWKERLTSKITASIILYPNEYTIFRKYVKNNDSLATNTSCHLDVYNQLIFNKIFSNYFVFDKSIKNIKSNYIKEYEKYKDDTYNKLNQELDNSYNIFNQLYEELKYSNSEDALIDVLYDFNNFTDVKSGEKQLKDVIFVVFNEYCKEFLFDLYDSDVDKYNAIVDKLKKMKIGLQNIKTT